MKFDIFEIAALKEAAKKRTADGYNDKIKAQFETGKPIFHEVTLYATENDDYNELWYCESEDRYYARNVYGTPRWCTVCDPLGYCELDYTLHDNHIFMVGDGEKNYFAVSNLEGAEFPTLKETYLSEWDKIKKDYPHFGDNKTVSWFSEYLGNGSTMTTDKWLISFMDPAKYEKEIKGMYGYEENWVMYVKTIKREIIHTFNYLGIKYYIAKETKRHEVCGKEIIDYYVDDKETLDRYDYHVAFLDDYCEGKPGAVYPKRDAINILAKALKGIYEGKQISEILHLYGDFYYERFIGYNDAAERLLNGSYNRQYVNALIRNERREHTFWIHDDPAIEEKYPGYKKDHFYNYDPHGRRLV